MFHRPQCKLIPFCVVRGSARAEYEVRGPEIKAPLWNCNTSAYYKNYVSVASPPKA